MQPEYAEYTLVVDHFHILAMAFTISILISKSSIRQIFLVLSHTLFLEIQIPLRQEKNDGIMGSFLFCFLCVTTVATQWHSSESHMHLNTVSVENKLNAK